MYRVAEGERRVLDRPEATDADTNVIKQDPSASAPAFRPEPQRPRTTSTRSSSIPPTENDPRDVVLHSDGCAIALHLSVVQIRCPWLYLQLEQLRHLSVIKNGAISLKVMENEEVRALQDKRRTLPSAHFGIIKLYAWTTYSTRHHGYVDGDAASVSTLPDEVMRQILCDRLLDFVKALKPEQHSDVLTDMNSSSCGVLEERTRCTEARETTSQAWRGELFTLVQFGKFQLQVRVDITDEMPILWRIIRTSSPNLLTTDPDYYAAFDDDPQFWIRSQMKVKYWRAQPNPQRFLMRLFSSISIATRSTVGGAISYPLSFSLAPVVSTAAFQPEITGKVKFRGRFFIWGDPVCSMYHVLLHNTLFYSAPQCSSTEVTDLLYNGSAKDVVCLYKCVRWCFVPIDDIIGTLRHSPRELKFYELIEEGLQDTYRRFLRRARGGGATQGGPSKLLQLSKYSFNRGTKQQHRAPQQRSRDDHEKFMKFLKGVAETATRVLTVCTGSAIGPQIQDGKIRTSSGVTAGMDMAHAFMASTYGQDVAETMARYMENVPNTYPSDDPFLLYPRQCINENPI
ncbi:Class I glutamine amidotransferase-like [Phytophthora cactorum]|nr:Class I glutamine amidotransferase-like [Phytophthora cactorum]